jgi:drug/metabolite transporter (DMT)-like permease
MPDRQTIHRAYAAWVSVCVVWGTTYLAIRVALETIPPALIGGLRFTTAGAVLVLLLRMRGVPVPALQAWPALSLAGVLLLVVGNGGVIWAEQWVPSGIAAVLVASQPFWIAGIESLLPDGERLSARALLGLLTGFGGIVVLVWPELTAGGASGLQFAVGVLTIQIACVGWSLGSIYSKRRPAGENAIAASAIQMLIGGLVFLLLATLRGEWSDLSFSARSLAAELYLVIFGSFAGYSAYIYSLKYLPITTVSLYTYINPLIAVVLGWALLSEPFGWRIVAASLLVLAGVATVRSSVMTRSSRGARPAPVTLPGLDRERRLARPDDAKVTPAGGGGTSSTS